MPKGWINDYNSAANFLCRKIRDRLIAAPDDIKHNATEIRLNLGSPVHAFVRGKLIPIGCEKVTARELEECMITLTENSFHSHQHELKEGFISVTGGHRAGIAATAAYSDSGEIAGLRDVNGIVLRIAHTPDENARRTAKMLASHLEGMLIAGPPGSGKTTLIRSLSDILAERGERVVLIDERGEMQTDTNGVCRLTGYEKSKGMMMALRTLSPSVIICDELGGKDDVESVLWALNCGVPVIGTAHAKSISELFLRKGTSLLIETGAFPRIAVLSAENAGDLTEVMEHDGETYRRCDDSFVRCADRDNSWWERTAQDIIDRAGDTFSCDGETAAALFVDEDECSFAVCL